MKTKLLKNIRGGTWSTERGDRRSKQEVSIITQNESVDEEDMLDDEGVEDERDICEVTHVSEENLETTEGNFWRWWDGHRLTTRRRRRTCLDYGLDDCLIYCVLFFHINIVEPCDQQVHS